MTTRMATCFAKFRDNSSFVWSLLLSQLYGLFLALLFLRFIIQGNIDGYVIDVLPCFTAHLYNFNNLRELEMQVV